MLHLPGSVKQKVLERHISMSATWKHPSETECSHPQMMLSLTDINSKDTPPTRIKDVSMDS